MTKTPLPLFDDIPNDPATLLADYQEVRRTTERLCAPLPIEDYMIQAMPEASPTRWHIGHVSWFFETFVLNSHLPGYQLVNPAYQYLFNSYYNAAGPQFSRPHRGHLSRPTVAEVYEYRKRVDYSMADLLEVAEPQEMAQIASLIALGLNHEQQHQELIFTDLKYNLSVNPLRPAYHTREIPRGVTSSQLRWVEFEGGVHMIGHDKRGFAFDNEWPRHQALVHPFRLASRLVTNGEYLEFMESGGYERWDLWLSEGWKTIQEQEWNAPLYWENLDGVWWMQTVDEHAPVAHVSYYEADAYARWRDRRLPTEQEWEHAAEGEQLQGNLQESGLYHPLPAGNNESQFEQLIGDLWEWTQSPYVPYPGFRPLGGDLGEYNGKFMVNQMVLRGGSCVTPQSHIRATYRNFFPADARWQFSGIRLTDDM